tara:strand:- start:3918 stop:4145 length:228 start_codon:yes stop_codon:yes gene_type:complete
MEGQLTEEQLRILKSKLETLTRIHAEIGLLESKKHELLHSAVTNKTKLQDYQKELQEEYGDISINVEDGTFTKPE